MFMRVRDGGGVGEGFFDGRDGRRTENIIQGTAVQEFTINGEASESLGRGEAGIDPISSLIDKANVSCCGVGVGDEDFDIGVMGFKEFYRLAYEPGF